jgi:putative hydrolase of the HAD superfamily
MEIQPIEGAVQTLAALKPRFRIGVISNTVGSGDLEVAQVLEQAGVAGFIDALVTSRDFGRAKPDPAIYVEAARRLGVPLELSCMVGDRLDTDIAGAINAGIASVWLRHPGAVEIDGIIPSHVITRLADLPAWLQAA